MTKTISEARGTLGDKTLKKNKLDPKVAPVLDAAELVLKDYFTNGIPKQHLMLALKKALEVYESR
jgi:hypothetical protein